MGSQGRRLENRSQLTWIRRIVAAVILPVLLGWMSTRVPLLGQRFSPPQGHVENVSFEQVPGGVINIYYDLVSDSPDSVFTIAVKASDDGGKTFTLQPSAITGDVSNVKPGRRKKVVWRSGQDVAVLTFDLLKFDVVATAGQTTPAPGPAGPPPAGGGSKMKIILPVAGGGAAAAALLLKPKEKDCTFSASPTSLDFAAAGEAKTVNVSVTPADCKSPGWTASSSANFVSVSPGSGTGSGSVTFTAAANTGGSRNGTATVAGTSISLNQGATPACTTISASPNPVSVGSAAGAAPAVTVTLSPSGCAPNTWTAAIGTNPGTFITNLTPTTGSSGQTFGFSVTANTGAARSGTINVTGPAGVTTSVAVNQSITACTYTVTRSPSGNIGAAGANVVVSVTTQSTCAWTASFNPNPTQTAAPGRMLNFGNMTTNGGLTASGTGTNTNLMVQVAALAAAGTRTGTVIIADVASGNANVGNVSITQTNP
jgi:hypothetical protein